MLEKDKFEGLDRKVQLKPLKWEKDDDTGKVKKVTQVLMVLKWGGSLTHAGVDQARNLGKSFRERMYIEDKGLAGD